MAAGSLQAEIDATGHLDISNFLPYEGWKTCSMCHSSGSADFTQHVQDIMGSVHWDWEKVDPVNGNTVGKYYVINNYCVAVKSNEPRCTSCHIGIGWTDAAAFSNMTEDNIDCLICHDGSKTYRKIPTGAGAPQPNKFGLPGSADPGSDVYNPAAVAMDYNEIVRSFQLPDRDNCGICHFYGGGGEGVKHGTMDGSLSMANAVASVDVHMGGDSDMTCISCHSFDPNNERNSLDFLGSRYSQTHTDEQMCVDCHTGANAPVHPFFDHTSSLACQTCHVPALARGGKATKTYWDWQTANNAKLKDAQGNTVLDPYSGKPVDLVIKNGDGDIVFHGKKGTFVWGYNIVPEYAWANGTVNTLSLDTLDANPVQPGDVVQMNSFEGGPSAGGKIFPVKVFRGIQPYDAGNGVMAVPNLFPFGDDPGAFWKGGANNDWVQPFVTGGAAEPLPTTFSGTVGFIETEMTWIGNHMVAPAAEAVQCWECHMSTDRIDRAAMGLSVGSQSDDYNVTYSGYRIEYLNLDPVGFFGNYPAPTADSMQLIDTGAYMGYLEVSKAPWVYSYNMGKYLYIPEDGAGLFGNWTYMPK